MMACPPLKRLFGVLLPLWTICLLRAINPVGAVDRFDIFDGVILRNGSPIVFTGVNAMHVYGGNSSSIAAHNLSIVREFVGNVQYQPITSPGGYSIKSPDGAWLQPLSQIVKGNRELGLTTILDLHRWNESHATEFWAKTPSKTPWWDDYKLRLTQVFLPFAASQPDVWLSPWNEPFSWDYSDGHTPEIWYDEMRALVKLIRDAGVSNVVVLPVGAMGQDESVLLSMGQTLVGEFANVIFDIHAYQRWLKKPRDEIRRRMRALQDLELPFLFGEVGPANAGELMNTSGFLQEANEIGASVLAWIWKCRANPGDGNALLDCSIPGDPVLNDKDNGHWGSTFTAFANNRQSVSSPLDTTLSPNATVAGNETSAAVSTTETPNFASLIPAALVLAGWLVLQAW